MKYPVFVGIHIAIVVICGICLIWFHRRRRLHPIPGRYPLSSILTAVVTMVTVGNQGLIVGLDQSVLPCWVVCSQLNLPNAPRLHWHMLNVICVVWINNYNRTHSRMCGCYH
jgi:hypothetical protein